MSQIIPTVPPTLTELDARYWTRAAADARYYERTVSDARYYERSLADAAFLTQTEGDERYTQIQAKVRHVYDATTAERGTQVLLTNKTGSASVKGQVVVVYSAGAVDRAFTTAAADTLDAFGVVAEDGIADASECWVWMPGSICQVALQNETASTRGHWCRVSASAAGRITTSAVPNPPTDAIHFREVGHCLESVSAGAAGVKKLATIALHFL